MSLSALPTALLLPPVNLLSLGVVGLLLAGRYPRFGRAVTGVALAGLVVLALPVTSQLLMASLQEGIPRIVPARTAPETATEMPAAPPVGAIVVLSAESGGSGQGGILPWHGVGPMTLERLQAGAALSRRLGLPLLVSGGVPEPGAPSLAGQMARSLREDFGMSAAWVEARSDDTWQNAEYSSAMLKSSGIRTVYVVTSGWHMRRALMAFRHFGVDAIPVASRFDSGPQFDVGSFIPRVSAWQRSYFALHEWMGCAYYALRR